MLANGGVAALAGLPAWLYPQQAGLWQLAAAASLASASADALSSELGSIYGRSFYNILTFKKDKCGLDGVISLEGTLWGYCRQRIDRIDLCDRLWKCFAGPMDNTGRFYWQYNRFIARRLT